MAADILPVQYFCKACGWASRSSSSPLSRCGRCGGTELEKLSVPNEQKDSIETESVPVHFLNPQSSNSGSGLNRDKNEKISPQNFSLPAAAFTISMGEVKKKDTVDSSWQNNPKIRLDDSKMEDLKAKKHVNRRSRAYSWQFVKNVVMQKNSDLAIPNPVIEEQIQVQARPVVNKIVELVPMFKMKDGTLALDAIKNLLDQEKEKGTPWKEIADETMMELILHGLNALNFIVALINAYDIPTSEVGLFLATPPDEGTMSLIEEAVCQDSLDLFKEVLRMDEKLLKGLLECKDTTEQVHKEIFALLNDTGAAEE